MDPLLMNAFNTVNLAAACILTTVSYAKELGVPQDKWVYPLGGAGTQDSDECKICPNKVNSRVHGNADKVQSGKDRTTTLALQ
jgi:hypothetical protein